MLDMTDQYLLLAIVLICFIVVAILLVAAVVVVVRRLLRKRPARGTTLRAAALLAASVAVGSYAWGALHLTRDESGALSLCQATVPAARAGDKLTYDVSFVPLRGQCRVPGVGSFDTRGVSGNFGDPLPDYVNPTVAVATCLTFAFFIAVRRFPDDESSELKAPTRDRTEGLTR
jgi:hypothetical protein